MYEDKPQKKIVAGLLVAVVAVIAFATILLGALGYFWLLRFSTIPS